MKGEKTLITLKGLEELNKMIMEQSISYFCPKSFDLNQLDSFRERREAEEAEVLSRFNFKRKLSMIHPAR